MTPHALHALQAAGMFGMQVLAAGLAKTAGTRGIGIRVVTILMALEAQVIELIGAGIRRIAVRGTGRAGHEIVLALQEERQVRTMRPPGGAVIGRLPVGSHGAAWR